MRGELSSSSLRAAEFKPAQTLQLSRARLHLLAPEVQRPSFAPGVLRPGILHLGCGSFHRAHQAFLTQRAVEWEYGAGRRLQCGAPPPWGIVATSLITPGIVDALAAQDGLYTVLERGCDRTHATLIGSLSELVYAPRDPARLRRAFADPAIRLVTLTVTVGGYGADAYGRLDAGAAVRDDLHGPHPRTAIGWLVAGLRQRWRTGMAPPVVMSCDNLPSNGRLLRQLCVDMAALQDDCLSAWIARQVQFPSTMVDRIVPATSALDVQDASAALGLVDAAPVCAEPFHQWVIERFDGARPRWDAVGAEYVGDVAPWEASKLRLLNGGHLAIACLGRLAGCATIADAMTVAGFAAFALRFMIDEQKPTLPPSEHDIDAYARQLLERWSSRGIAHQVDRVARDASSKLPARLLDALRDNRRAGRPTPCTVLAVAAWMRCIAGHDDAGMAFSVPDALCARMQRRVADARDDPPRLVDVLLALPSIFGDDLPRDEKLRRELIQAVSLLQQRGARGAVAACVAGLVAAE